VLIQAFNINNANVFDITTRVILFFKLFIKLFILNLFLDLIVFSSIIRSEKILNYLKLYNGVKFYFRFI